MDKNFLLDPITNLYLPSSLVSTSNIIIASGLFGKNDLYSKTGDNYDKISRLFTLRNENSAFMIKKKIDQNLLADLGEGAKVLDIGCGAGIYTKYMNETGYNVTGVDISAEQIKSAKEQDPESTYINANILDLELPHRYEGVLMNSMFQYILKEDNLKLLQKVRKLLTDKGFVYMIVKVNAESTQEFKTGFSHGKQANKIIARYTKLEYNMLIQRAGFTILAEQKEAHPAHPDQPFYHLKLQKQSDAE